MWIVMTSAACMPRRCKGTYRNVALVQLTQDYTSHNKLPKTLSFRARGVKRFVHMGHHHVGKTDRCAYRLVLAQAEAMAYARNNTPLVSGEDLSAWGGSA